MLIKRLGGISPRPDDTGSPSGLAAAGNAQPAPGALNTGNIAPAAGTAPLIRNTVLVGRYNIDQVLGVGGMSTVYKARDLRFATVARYCAIKEMPDTSPDPRTGQIRLATFEREASLLATLSHPGIPKIYDFFSHGGRVYLVLEFIDGKDLETQLGLRGGPMTEDEVVRWSAQILEVLEYLHGHQPQPIIFRDMKPSNIIVNSDGKVTLIDFGIAKVFQSDKRGTMIGTEGYAPPEQYRGLAEPRGDIYALGATMHHLLTNSDPRVQTPFTFHERPVRHFNPRVSEYVESVILRSLEYDIDRRWPSAEAFRHALTQSSAYESGPKGRSDSLAHDLSGPLISSVQPPRLSGTSPTLVPLPRDPGSAVLRNGPAGPESGLLNFPTATSISMAPRVTVSQAGAEGAQVLWTFTADDEVRSSPFCGRGVVFFGSYDTNLYALNAKTGDFLWKATTKAGICSSPALVGDQVIAGSEDGYVYAFDARRGSLSWSYRTGGPVRSSPKVGANDVIVIGSDDQYVYCFQAETGQVLWRYRTWNFVRSSAAFGKGLVFIGSSDGNLYAVDILNGTLKWKLHTLGAIIGTPLVVNNNVIVGSMDNYIYAVDADTGFTAWRHECQRPISSSPAAQGERLLIGSSDGFLYALDAPSGRSLWSYEAGSPITSSPRVSPVTDGVYFGTTNNYVYSLDIITGDVRWRFRTRGPVVSSPAIEDGILYIGSLDRKMYALAI